MSSEVYTIVEPYRHPDAEAPFGERDDKILKASFPMSPVMYTNDPDRLLTDEKLRDKYYDIVKDYSEVSPDRGQAPDMVQVANAMNDGDGGTAIGNTIGNPETGEVVHFWPVPNPGSSFNTNSSPGASPSYQEKFEGTIDQKSINYGSGPSQPVSPSKSTVEIESQDFRLGRLTLGSSS